MVLRYFIISLLLAVLPSSLPAQSSVTVNVDDRVENLLDLFQRVNEEEKQTPGWRVQILATTDRARLETVETEFKVNYPNIPVDWVHAKPYYKLRAGAFSTKQEAERLRYTLSRQFDGVYLVKDDVQKAELLRMY